MNETPRSSGPIALLVEDEPKSLKLRQGLLKQHGFLALAVQTAEDAMREFAASPGVDLVITDIRLNPQIPGDKSGVELAEQLKHVAADIPIVGYSAAFAENDLTHEEIGLFTSYYSRGNEKATEIIKHVEKWRRMAEAFRERRRRAAQAKLEEYRRKYPVPEPDFATLRFLVPHRLAQPGGSAESIEDVLHEAGFQFRLIERGHSRPTLADSPAIVKAPIPVWLRTTEGTPVAEVYGFPELYSFGNTEEDAIRNLLLLMDGYYHDSKVHSSSDSNRVKAIDQFLREVFE